MADQYPTADAYERACRAVNWRTAELRFHGHEPISIPHNAPPYPPDDYDFDIPPEPPVALFLPKSVIDSCGSDMKCMEMVQRQTILRPLLVYEQGPVGYPPREVGTISEKELVHVGQH